MHSRAYSKDFFRTAQYPSTISFLLPHVSPPFFSIPFLPLELGPLNPTRGFVEHSPSRFWSRAKTEIEFDAFFALKFDTW